MRAPHAKHHPRASTSKPKGPQSEVERRAAFAAALLLPPFSPPSALPVLFATPTAAAEDVQVRVHYICALILRAHVLSWYDKISPRDTDFLPAVGAVLALVLRSLFAGLARDPDRVARLLLLHLPVVLSLHMQTYWSARAALKAQTAVDGAGRPLRLDGAYHARLPLLCVTPVSVPDPDALSCPPTRAPTPPPPASVGAGAVASRHPEPEPNADDAAAAAAAAAVAAAVAEAVCDRHCRTVPEVTTYILSPTYLTALVDSLLAIHLGPEDYAADAERTIVREIVGRAVLGTVGRRLSAPWFLAQIGLKLISERGGRTSDDGAGTHGAETTRPAPDGTAAAARRAIGRAAGTWAALRSSATLLWAACLWLSAAYRAAPPADSAYTRVLDPWLLLLRTTLAAGGEPTWPARLALGTLELLAALLAPLADCLIPHLVLTHLLTIGTVAKLTELLEKILFPLEGGWPSPTPPDPTREEAAQLEADLRARVAGRIPSPVAALFPGTARLVDPIADQGCNAHLIGMLYDAVIATIEPDLVGE